MKPGENAQTLMTTNGDRCCPGTGRRDAKRKTARRRLKARRRFNREEEDKEDLVGEGLRTPARFGDRRHNNYFQASNLSRPTR